MPNNIALCCKQCNYYNLVAAPGANAHFQSGPLTRHGKRCGGQIYVIHNPMPDKKWNGITKAIETLSELADDEDDKTITRYIDKTLDWLQSRKDAYLSTAVPMDYTSPSDGETFAAQHKIDV